MANLVDNVAVLAGAVARHRETSARLVTSIEEFRTPETKAAGLLGRKTEVVRPSSFDLLQGDLHGMPDAHASIAVDQLARLNADAQAFTESNSAVLQARIDALTGVTRLEQEGLSRTEGDRLRAAIQRLGNVGTTQPQAQFMFGQEVASWTNAAARNAQGATTQAIEHTDGHYRYWLNEVFDSASAAAAHGRDDAQPAIDALGDVESTIKAAHVRDTHAQAWADRLISGTETRFSENAEHDEPIADGVREGWSSRLAS